MTTLIVAAHPDDETIWFLPVLEVADLIIAGAHPKAIQGRLGDSSIEITMDTYGHLLPSVDAALAAALDVTHANATPDNVRELRPAEG